MKMKFYSVASYIYKGWQWCYSFDHDKKIKTKTDYEDITKMALQVNNEKWENIERLTLTNIITFINK
jgi:hypothetical protein